MKEKTSHPILVTIIILLSVAFCAAIFTVVAQNFRFINIPDDTSAEDLSSAIPGDSKPYNFDYSWTEDHPYISHAMGGILGHSYTNSYEAFLLNYQLGHRIFEVDFILTDDDHTVAAHDSDSWKNNAVIKNDAEVRPSAINPTQFTYANFMSSLWYDQYHTVDLDLLFRILEKYPDVYIVTDSKYIDETNIRKQFTTFVETAQDIDLALLDRFIPQIYHPEMLDWIMDIYPWKSVIYTLYQEPNWTPESVLEFAEASGVKCITLWDTLFNEALDETDIESWKASNLKIATHTINYYARAENSRARGADLIYTDYLLPQPSTN